MRLTGYTNAGELVQDEAAAVRQMFGRFHAGDSLRGVVAWLTAEVAATRSGRPWNPSSVRTILTNPRYAGRVVYRGQYRGEVTGKLGAWPPLVEEWLFDAVQATLADPRRREQADTHRRHLGSGLVPVRRVRSARPGAYEHPVRRCVTAAVQVPQGGHITRSAAQANRTALARAAWLPVHIVPGACHGVRLQKVTANKRTAYDIRRYGR